MNKDTFYFSHDYNARTDDKIKRLIRTHGMEGYGIFWSIVEDLYNNANALRLDCDGIAFDLHTQTDIVKSIINNFDLFVIENDRFSSTSIERRLSERNGKSEKARQSAFSRWNKNKTDANALPTQSDCNAIKERKGKNNKGKDKLFAPPAIEDVKLYFKENGYNEAEKFFNFYSVADWKDSKGNQVKNWKQKAMSVWFKPENKIHSPEYTPQPLYR